MPGTEKALDDESLLAPDQLHPSGKEYARWANMVSTLISSELP
jgi:lysophospholipase L1-like esterase